MTRHPLKIKPLTAELRARLRALPVPGVVVIEKNEFRPTTRWFAHENQGTGCYFSIRRMDDQLFVFRLK